MKYINDTLKTRYRCIIEEDKSVGFYLYVYDKATGACLEDHLQDTLEIAKQQAEDEFGAEASRWAVQET